MMETHSFLTWSVMGLIKSLHEKKLLPKDDPVISQLQKSFSKACSSMVTGLTSSTAFVTMKRRQLLLSHVVPSVSEAQKRNLLSDPFFQTGSLFDASSVKSARSAARNLSLFKPHLQDSTSRSKSRRQPYSGSSNKRDSSKQASRPSSPGRSSSPFRQQSGRKGDPRFYKKSSGAPQKRGFSEVGVLSLYGGWRLPSQPLVGLASWGGGRLDGGGSAGWLSDPLRPLVSSFQASSSPAGVLPSVHRGSRLNPGASRPSSEGGSTSSPTVSGFLQPSLPRPEGFGVMGPHHRSVDPEHLRCLVTLPHGGSSVNPEFHPLRRMGTLSRPAGHVPSGPVASPFASLSSLRDAQKIVQVQGPLIRSVDRTRSLHEDSGPGVRHPPQVRSKISPSPDRLAHLGLSSRRLLSVKEQTPTNLGCSSPTRGESPSSSRSSDRHLKESSSQTELIEEVQVHSHSSVLTSERMVPGPSGTIVRRSRHTVRSKTSSKTVPLPPIPPKSAYASADCMATIKCFAIQSGFSPAVAGQLIFSRRLSTRLNYQARWGTYRKWCKDFHHRSSSPSIAKIADFLTFMFKTKGAALSTIKGYRAMLAAVFKFPLPEISTSPILKDLIRSFEISAPRPIFPPPPWELDRVLQFLSGPPFEPLARASFLDKTKKALFLLAMATAKRVSELQALSFSVSFQGEDLVLYYDPFFRAKTESVANPLPRSIIVPSLSDFAGDLPERVHCPVRAVKYLCKAARSASFIPSRLFVSPRNPERAMSFYLRQLIVDSGAVSSARPPRAHDIRGISTSLNYYSNLSLSNLMQVATWRSNSVFASRYLKEVSATQDNIQQFGPLVIAGDRLKPKTLQRKHRLCLLPVHLGLMTFVVFPLLSITTVISLCPTLCRLLRGGRTVFSLLATLKRSLPRRIISSSLDHWLLLGIG